MNSSVNLAKRSLAVWLAIVLAIGLSFSSWAANGFRYQHDPRENPAAMRDIAEDENAVYGFRPSETGRLKLYADADWSDPAVVEQGRQDRIAYHESIASMYVLLEEMEAQGCSVEEIARAVSTRRNEIRLEAYADDPEALAALKARNLEKYGHEEGPLPDELYAQYGSWDRVLEKAFNPNAGMDACLGLYDDYYFLYVALGDVPADLPEQDDSPGTAAPDDPAESGSLSGDDLCPWDDTDHGASLWGRLIRLFHSILFFFARLFGGR